MEYIINFEPYKEDSIDIEYYSGIEKRVSNSESITQNEVEDYLRMLNYLTRKKINQNMDNFDYKCDLAQSILCDYLHKVGCKYSACATHMAIVPGVVGHSFTTVEINVEGEEKLFLLDPTYIQFFKKEKCQHSNYITSPLIPNKVLITPDPGYFIKEEDKDPIEFLLKYGYIELTPEYARIYGDSFYNTKPGENLQNIEFKSLPGIAYINAFSKSTEVPSKNETELITTSQNISLFQNLEKAPTKVV